MVKEVCLFATTDNANGFILPIDSLTRDRTNRLLAKCNPIMVLNAKGDEPRAGPSNERRTRSFEMSCNDRANAGHRQKTRRSEGFRGKGRQIWGRTSSGERRPNGELAKARRIQIWKAGTEPASSCLPDSFLRTSRHRGGAVHFKLPQQRAEARRRRASPTWRIGRGARRQDATGRRWKIC